MADQAAGGYTTIVAAGGDGTAHEVANGLLRAAGERETVALGIVPLGSGDDFAKELPPRPPTGGEPFDWRAAVDKLTRPVTRDYEW